MVAIPGGSFLMGREGSRADEAPLHRVELPPFRAAVRPVSNEEYRAYVEATSAPSARFWEELHFSAPEQPVVGVSWFEAVAYCQWLSATTGISVRLPTEAEREFAALGGLSGGDWPWPGAAHPLAAEIGRMDGPHVPRDACANGYGLLCMAENVHEWCSDWYSATYYAISPGRSPRGPSTGKRRASRGGSWRHSVKFTRINARSSIPPAFRYNDYGFRVYGDE
jgi:formylglycine-generating enzyme required for sulfatase activity